MPAGLIAAVRDALRNFRVPRELARSSLASGSTVQERAESVRHLLRQATNEAFGDTETERLLHSVLPACYISPLRSPGAAATSLWLSRTANLPRPRTPVHRVANPLAMAGQGIPMAA